MKFNFQYINLEKFTAISCVIYLFLSIKPLPMWVLPESLVYGLLICLLFSLFVFLGFRKELVFSNYNIVIAFVILAFVSFIALPIRREFVWFTFLRYIPFFFIIFFPARIHYKAFRIFRNWIIFFSAYGIVIFFIKFIGIELPYHKIDGFTIPMEKGNHFYKVYGLVVSSTNTEFRLLGFNISRVCGPFLEPGHFAIYIGITLGIEKAIYGKISKLPVIAGFLTFSPAFIIILMFIMIYDVVFKRSFKLLITVVATITFLMTVIVTNQVLKDVFYYLAIGRNLDNVETDVLDERTAKYTVNAYNNFTNTSKLYTGMGAKYVDKRYGILSDYRGFIFRYGLIGFLLSTILLIAIFTKGNSRLLFLYVPIVILIYTHRYWMFVGPYIYILLFFGTLSHKLKNYN